MNDQRPAHVDFAWDEPIEPPYAGPACTVVWQGEVTLPPMPIVRMAAAEKLLTAKDAKKSRKGR